MKALITGVSGFVGNHLARLLLQEGLQVWGTVVEDRETLDKDISSGVTLVKCDITDPLQIRKVLEACQPDYVFHLAAQSSVAKSWENPTETYKINLLGTVNLLEEVAQSNFASRILLIGSAEEYGSNAAKEGPTGEITALNPLNPYGISKAAVSMMFRQYLMKYGLEIIYARAFNHIGPGQAPGFVTVDFAKQIAEINLGLRKPFIKVGNLTAQRDFTDVRDIVRAYWLLMQRGAVGEIYNVASGTPVAMQEILNILLSKANREIQVETDLQKLRVADNPVVYGDITKIQEATGWRPTIPLAESLNDILNHWHLHLLTEQKVGK